MRTPPKKVPLIFGNSQIVRLSPRSITSERPPCEVFRVMCQYLVTRLCVVSCVELRNSRVRRSGGNKFSQGSLIKAKLAYIGLVYHEAPVVYLFEIGGCSDFGRHGWLLRFCNLPHVVQDPKPYAGKPRSLTLTLNPKPYTLNLSVLRVQGFRISGCRDQGIWGLGPNV